MLQVADGVACRQRSAPALDIPLALLDRLTRVSHVWMDNSVKHFGSRNRVSSVRMANSVNSFLDRPMLFVILHRETVVAALDIFSANDVSLFRTGKSVSDITTPISGYHFSSAVSHVRTANIVRHVSSAKTVGLLRVADSFR